LATVIFALGKNNILGPRANIQSIEFMFSIGALYKDENIFISRLMIVFLKDGLRSRGNCSFVAAEVGGSGTVGTLRWPHQKTAVFKNYSSAILK
jgi:hypothetical protein